MAQIKSQTPDPFEERLRRRLAVEARAAPMPPLVLEIPDSWTRDPRRARLGATAKVLAIAASAVLVVAAVTQLPRLGPLGARTVEARTAAAYLGVPVVHVVETRDGAIGIRPIPGADRTVEVVLVTRGESALVTHQLSRIQVPTGTERSVSLWAVPISCSRDTGLRQPNLIVGGADPAADGVRVGNRDIPTHGGLFVTAFETVDFAHDDQLSVVFGGVNWADRAEVLLTGAAFGRNDACTGELWIP